MYRLLLSLIVLLLDFPASSKRSRKSDSSTLFLCLTARVGKEEIISKRAAKRILQFPNIITCVWEIAAGDDLILRKARLVLAKWEKKGQIARIQI